ncbi:NAD-dependent epimerase/dehydratase family protein [Microbacterium schleiferi]|uniref:NAD-dependent epimerase/dehydratase family protein n=1 Tax=Microbacterium schleiferi TaxID=69362 RepID=A0ABU7V6J9_9MICO
MRRVLVLGGTGWLGRELVSAALALGADVTCVARSESGTAPEGAHFLAADRRRPDAYRELVGDWDEVIELSSEPDLVVPAVTELGSRAAHWTLVSTVSVYAADDEPGADESAALVEPVDLSRYADAKVAAEQVTSAALGDRLLIARPGLIVGPGDPSDRFGYWPARLDRGGPTIVPVMQNRFVQVIDVADLASWLAAAGSARLTGRINAVGPPLPMTDFFTAARAVTGFRGELIDVTDAVLEAHGIQYWAGPRSLPLWLPSRATGFAQRDRSAYLRAGGTARSMTDTLTRVLQDERARGLDRPRRAGLTADEETSLIRGLAG